MREASILAYSSVYCCWLYIIIFATNDFTYWTVLLTSKSGFDVLEIGALRKESGEWVDGR